MPSSLTDDLEHVWRMDEVGDQTVDRLDSVGSADLLYGGVPSGVTSGVSGKHNNALSLTIQRFVSTAVAGWPDFTITGWFNSAGSPLSQTILKFVDGSAPAVTWLALYANSSGTQITLQAEVNSGGMLQTSTSGLSLSGNWVFFAIRVTGAKMELRIDGGSWTEQTHAANLSALDDFEVGPFGHVSSGGGSIDELAIWSAALSDSEVDELATGDSYDSFWPFTISGSGVDLGVAELEAVEGVGVAVGFDELGGVSSVGVDLGLAELDTIEGVGVAFGFDELGGVSSVGVDLGLAELDTIEGVGVAFGFDELGGVSSVAVGIGLADIDTIEGVGVAFGFDELGGVSSVGVGIGLAVIDTLAGIGIAIGFDELADEISSVGLAIGVSSDLDAIDGIGIAIGAARDDSVDSVVIGITPTPDLDAVDSACLAIGFDTVHRPESVGVAIGAALDDAVESVGIQFNFSGFDIELPESQFGFVFVVPRLFDREIRSVTLGSVKATPAKLSAIEVIE